VASRRIGIAVTGLLLLSACSVLAQDNTFPKVELAPEFEYIRSSPNFTHAFELNGQQVSGSNDFNCAGGGGMFGYNFTSLFGLTADLDYCRFFGNTIRIGQHNYRESVYIFVRAEAFVSKPEPVCAIFRSELRRRSGRCPKLR
jgi:hypothetical protein